VTTPVICPAQPTLTRHRTGDNTGHNTSAPVKTPVHDDSRGHGTVTPLRIGHNTGENIGA